MDTLEIVAGISEATAILIKARNQSASGPLAIWRMISHAENHLNKEVEELLAPEPTERCVYCGGDIPQDVSGEVPALGDHESWDRIAKHHAAGCEWVLTRAYRAEYDSSLD